MERFFKNFVNNFESIESIYNHYMVKIPSKGGCANLQENNKEYKISIYLNSA